MDLNHLSFTRRFYRALGSPVPSLPVIGCDARESNPVFPAYETSVVFRSTRPHKWCPASTPDRVPRYIRAATEKMAES